MLNSLEKYVGAFQSFNMAPGEDGAKRPHKPVMLLAVMDLFESGFIFENRIEYSPELLSQFGRYFDIVKKGNDQCTPLNPFFYLRSEGFWHHKANPGKEAICAALKNPGGVGALLEVVECVYLDEDLYALMHDPVSRETLRQAIINRYFAEYREQLAEEFNGSVYAKYLQENVEALKVEDSGISEAVRSSGFRKAVLSAYDYCCAACGLRVILDDGKTIVDAAHIIPFNVSHDDNPRNGMALCKNHHWAMDRFLLVPGPDLKWHVSKNLDDRIAGQREILDLNGRGLLLPRQEKYYPKEEALEWRMGQLN